MKSLQSDFDGYDYVISIDVGTTFSGSCYTCTKDENAIVHVTKWPEQKDLDTFEKTPTACLYDTSTPPRLISWGKAAMDYTTTHPNDSNTRLISQFKLKLQGIFQNNQLQDVTNDYRTAAVDYLRAIHQYTCEQLIRNSPAATYDQFRYVLTVPATWVNEDATAMRQLAKEAGLISDEDKNARLVVLSEAHAASLFCEREYCATTQNALCKGQRYLVCDAGGGTVDLATYECTDTKEHCQLALESGGPCGSTILDLNMKMYLKNQVFLGCIEEFVLNGLVDQFKTEIKHYFGDDNGKNNYIELANKTNQVTDAVENELALTLATSTTVSTTKATEMKDIQENDYDYQADYDEYDSDFMIIGDEDQEDFDDMDKDSDDDEEYIPESLSCHEISNKKDEIAEYVYFTLPEKGTDGIDSSILENLALRGSITPAGQLRVSHRDISKHVFDPVVSTVMVLIRKQIKKSYTTIDTLFLLGGFGQSPYLYKKLHEEFITSTNAVKHLVVPEDGYRASMRGGVHYGMDCSKVIPEVYLKDEYGAFLKHSVDFPSDHTLVAIDFDFYNFTAIYSLVDLNQVGGKGYKALGNLLELKMTMEDYDIKSFSFDTDRFLNSFFHQLVTILRTHQLVFDGIDQYKPTEWNLRKQIYFDIFMTAFMQQLFEQIQLDFYASFTFDIQNIRYCASISNSRVNVDYGKGYDYDPMTAYEDEDTPIITLKRKLLSALTKTKDISSSLSSPMHSFLVQVLDKNAFPTKDSILKKELPGRMSAVFQSIGMIERETSETRFFWRIFPVDFEYIDLGVPYFSLQHYSVNQARSYGDNRLNMLVFDLAHDSLDMSRNREIEPCCRVYMPDIDGMINCRNRFQVYQLKYDAFCNDTSISSYINGNIILKDIQEGEFTVYALLRFIGTETDFLKSKKLRDYIRTDVDLADPQRRHTIGDLFLEHNSEVVIKMHFRTASLHLMKTIQHAIRLFARKTVTTYHIQRFLLIPWIKYVLTPAVLNAQNLFLKSNRDRKYAMFYFVFTEPLIETAFGGRRSFEYDMNETCSEYMIRELRNEIDSRIALFSHVTVRFLPNAQVNRHFGCLIEGARFSSSLTGKPQLINRISRRSYAIHFLNHYVKKTAIVSEKIKKEGEQIVDTKDGIKNADNKGNGQKKDDGKEEKQSEKTIISIDLQDSLTLYPLVEKDAFLNSILNKRLDNTEFYVKNECSVAAVLYASDHDMTSQDLYISNNSFRKLHRFIIPVTDTSKPIQFGCLVDNYSILFSVRQAEHKADFRCNDFMFIN